MYIIEQDKPILRLQVFINHGGIDQSNERPGAAITTLVIMQRSSVHSMWNRTTLSIRPFCSYPNGSLYISIVLTKLLVPLDVNEQTSSDHHPSMKAKKNIEVRVSSY